MGSEMCIRDRIVRFDNATPNEILEGMSLALEKNTEDKNVIIRPVITGSLAPGYHVYDLRLKDIQESVEALYVEYPVCSLEGISTPSVEITSKKSYEPVLQEYFKQRGYDLESSKKIAQLVIQIVKGLSPSSEERKGEARKKVLKLIEDFDLEEVRR
mgnify:CR=1 FL=1